MLAASMFAWGIFWRDGIITRAAPGLATANAADSQPAPAQKTVRLDGSDHEFTASWLKTAAAAHQERKHGRQRAFIKR